MLMRYPVMKHRLRVLEAACALSLVGILLRILPFRSVLKLAGDVRTGTVENAVKGRTGDPVAAGVGSAVVRAAAWLPWDAKCLVQALGGRLMLKRRGVPSVLVFGVAKKEDQISAHAWLVAGGGMVCGGREAPAFMPIAAFDNLTTRR
jgi:hypothetical protein